MNPRVITEPSSEPISLADAKLWCNVDDDITAQDAQILGLIVAMREMAEGITGQAFVQRLLEYRLDAFPSEDDGRIELPVVPLVSVASVSYVDANGAIQTMSGSPSQFREWTSGAVAPLYGSAWPGTRAEPEAVRIRYTAGYTSVAQVPEKLKLWMRTRISTLNENREQFIGSNQQPIPRDFADGLLDSLIVTKRFA